MYCIDASNLPSSELLQQQQQQEEECPIRNIYTHSSSSSSNRLGEMAEMLPPNREGIQRVVNVLQNSSSTCGTIAYPTESSYVLACNARSESSVNARKFIVLWFLFVCVGVCVVCGMKWVGLLLFLYLYVFLNGFCFFSWLGSFD